MIVPHPRKPLVFAVALLPLLAALAGSLAYWPGLVTWDSLRQYDQALSGAFDDWHPPVMEWIWRQMLPLAHSPAPMLLLQVVLYGTGFGLILAAFARQGRHRLAIVTGCCALQPVVVALMATIIKDSLMTGALLCAVGLVAQAQRRAEPAAGRWTDLSMRGGALLLCLFASMLRFNALPATLPIAFWALPPLWRAGWRRGVTAALLLAVPLAAAMPTANALIGAKHSDVALSLVIFDLAGITEYSGEDQFPPLGLRDAVAINHGCYEHDEWDSYSWWPDKLCPINFEVVRRAFRAQHRSPWSWWLSAVAHHPVAYLTHRARHWTIATRFTTGDPDERPVQVQAPPNDWGFTVTPNPIVRGVDWTARASAWTPLGWPCVWMAALAALLWRRRARLQVDLVTMLAVSALLYALCYAMVSVASELRYYLWTYVAGSIAIVTALGAPGAWRGGVGRWARTAGLPLAVIGVCIVMRLAVW